MECHKCEHREELADGKYAGIPFRRTPCARCELKQDSTRTMEVDPERPVYVPGGETGMPMPCPTEDEAAAEPELPMSVMEELVARLLTLPGELRDVVCWRFAGMEYQEIAKRQRITTAGAEARHRRAMRMFPELRELFVVKTARMKMRQGV
jgi:hypothetical protein